MTKNDADPPGVCGPNTLSAVANTGGTSQSSATSLLSVDASAAKSIRWSFYAYFKALEFGFLSGSLDFAVLRFNDGDGDLTFRVAKDGSVRLAVRNNNSTLSVPAGTLAPGKWYHYSVFLELTTPPLPTPRKGSIEVTNSDGPVVGQSFRANIAPTSPDRISLGITARTDGAKATVSYDGLRVTPVAP